MQQFDLFAAPVKQTRKAPEGLTPTYTATIGPGMIQIFNNFNLPKA